MDDNCRLSLRESSADEFTESVEELWKAEEASGGREPPESDETTR
jgi:hypothetical protein